MLILVYVDSNFVLIFPTTIDIAGFASNSVARPLSSSRIAVTTESIFVFTQPTVNGIMTKSMGRLEGSVARDMIRTNLRLEVGREQSITISIRRIIGYSPTPIISGSSILIQSGLP